MSHPITIYLSPTSTAVINVTQIDPPLADPTRRPFAILSPQAEVIVAPKLRQPPPVESEGPFDLTGAKNSAASTTKSKRPRRKVLDPSLTLRTICQPHPIFDDEVVDNLCLYVNPFIKTLPVFSEGLAKVSLLPSPSKPPVPLDKEKDNAPTNDTEFTNAKQIVAKVQMWEEAPEDHVGLSQRLATTLGIHGVGDLLRYLFNSKH
jgi:peroxin-1